ncbi:MAG: hypothetical protein RLY75_1272 [Pseudomonadota bacterium]
MLLKLLSGLVLMGVALAVGAATPQDLLKSYESQSGKASPTRGEQFFNAKHDKEWSCASCHENPPNHDTKHIVTGKVIKPLAPSANPVRFTDEAKAEKWFKRNCNDVLGRDCSAQEKADVLSWLMAVK